MGLLEGKVALITGAARGIGKAIALKFASEGADVAFTDLVINEAAEETIREIEAFGHKVKGYASNAADFEQSHDVVSQIVADFGRIDILVNNAGITKDGLMLRMTEAQWDAVINVNLTLTESQITTQLHDLGILPIKLVDERSAIEIDGIAQVDTASFDPTSLVLAADPSRLFEYKNACSVLEEATRFGANKEGIYSFVGENGSIAVMNKWYEEEVTNKVTAEQWVVPVPTNPKHICILNIFNSHVWA